MFKEFFRGWRTERNADFYRSRLPDNSTTDVGPLVTGGVGVAEKTILKNPPLPQIPKRLENTKPPIPKKN